MSKYRRTRYGKKKTVGYGWVGRWRDGRLGWVLPDHLGCGTNQPYDRDYLRPDDKLVLCKITVEVVSRSDGRCIGTRWGQLSS